jgi:hypothetical protein
VRVDETGAHDLSGCIDHPSRLRIRKTMAGDVHDPVARERDVGRIARIASSVGHPSAADQYV